MTFPAANHAPPPHIRRPAHVDNLVQTICAALESWTPGSTKATHRWVNMGGGHCPGRQLVIISKCCASKERCQKFGRQILQYANSRGHVQQHILDVLVPPTITEYVQQVPVLGFRHVINSIAMRADDVECL
jgi:hypothetical protein